MTFDVCCHFIQLARFYIENRNMSTGYIPRMYVYVPCKRVIQTMNYAGKLSFLLNLCLVSY